MKSLSWSGVVVGSVVGLLLPTLAATSVAATPLSAHERDDQSHAVRAAAPMPLLVGVRGKHRAGEDRIIFQFRKAVPLRTNVRYVDELRADGSGFRVRVPGHKVLAVQFEMARAHKENGTPTAAPRRRAFALPNVITAVRAGDFEGVVTYGLGVHRRRAVTVVTRPQAKRVVVKVEAGFRTVRQDVYFLDRDNFDSGTEPYVVPVKRRVPAAAPAGGLMDRVYAGPTPREQRDGLRLVRSRTRDWSDLEVSGGVARMRLLGRCSSGGSTVTIADHVLPTLRALPTVDWVKIYSRAGNTQTPGGASDSVPACLEP